MPSPDVVLQFFKVLSTDELEACIQRVGYKVRVSEVMTSLTQYDNIPMISPLITLWIIGAEEHIHHLSKKRVLRPASCPKMSIPEVYRAIEDRKISPGDLYAISNADITLEEFKATTTRTLRAVLRKLDHHITRMPRIPDEIQHKVRHYVDQGQQTIKNVIDNIDNPEVVERILQDHQIWF